MQTLRTIVLACAALALGACSQEQSQQSMQDEPAAPSSNTAAAKGSGMAGNAAPMAPTEAMPRATAVLKGTQGNESVRGQVVFQASADVVLVQAEIKGLEPGEHGFHVHENGDCSAPDASSAGGHFNPADHEHAGPDAERKHMGDMGNITAGEDGTARVDAEFGFLVLDPEADNSIMGKAVVVHAGADDMSSQPSGDAGARVACGVITNAPQ
jgi:Cu-Zn family superoxide dismutase